MIFIDHTSIKSLRIYVSRGTGFRSARGKNILSLDRTPRPEFLRAFCSNRLKPNSDSKDE